MSETGSEIRPDLTAAAPLKPDVLVRLEAEIPVTAAEGVDLAAWWAKNATARDAIAAIEYLRAANLRHCAEERELRAVEAELRDFEAENEALRNQVADLEAERDASQQPEGR